MFACNMNITFKPLNYLLKNSQAVKKWNGLGEKGVAKIVLMLTINATVIIKIY